MANERDKYSKDIADLMSPNVATAKQPNVVDTSGPTVTGDFYAPTSGEQVSDPLSGYTQPLDNPGANPVYSNTGPAPAAAAGPNSAPSGSVFYPRNSEGTLPTEANGSEPIVRAAPSTTQRATSAGAQGPSFGAMGATYDAELAAQRAAAAGQVGANEAQATGSAMLGDQQRRDAEAQQARAQEQAQQTQRQIGEIQRLSDEAASKQIDPSRWWHNQEGSSKVLYTLSAALGGFAAGWTHGPNLAMNQINRYIDDDIGAQKQAIEQAHGKVTDAKGVLGEMYQRFGNLNQAEAAARILHYDSMTNDVKAQVASAQSPTVAANGQILEAEIQRKKLEAQQRFAAAGAAKAVGQPALGKLSEEYGKAGLPEAQQAIDRVKSIANQSDPAGFGLFARTAHSLGADWMIPQEGLNNRAAVDQAVLKIAHATGRVTPQEIEAVRHGYLGAVENPAALKQFVSGVQAEIDAKRSNIQAGADPAAVQVQGALNDAYRRRSAVAPAAGLPAGSSLK
jgi:hypothetical protein